MKKVTQTLCHSKESPQLMEDVKALLDFLKINYDEKEVTDQEIQKREILYLNFIALYKSQNLIYSGISHPV